MAKKPTAIDVVPPTFTIYLQPQTCPSTTEHGRFVLTLSVRIVKQEPDSPQSDFFDNTIVYHGMTLEATQETRKIMRQGLARIEAEGISASFFSKLNALILDGPVKFVDLTYDQMMAVQQHFLNSLDDLTAKGFEHAAAKGIEVPKATALWDKRKGK